MNQRDFKMLVIKIVFIVFLFALVIGTLWTKNVDKGSQPAVAEQSKELPSELVVTTEEETTKESHEEKITRLVQEVESGKAGNGDARKEYLGDDYKEVQAIIDKKYKTTTQKKTTQVQTETPVSVNGDIIYGSMTGYGADCAGCSGTTASGYNVKNTIYYNDSTYGNVRVLAAPKNIPMYTVMLVSGVNGLDPFYAIVLDRGGAINGTLFDLLCESESYANKYIGRQKNVTYEIVRRGK